jgi:hypothetical protein
MLGKNSIRFGKGEDEERKRLLVTPAMTQSCFSRCGTSHARVV